MNLFNFKDRPGDVSAGRPRGTPKECRLVVGRFANTEAVALVCYFPPFQIKAILVVQARIVLLGSGSMGDCKHQVPVIARCYSGVCSSLHKARVLLKSIVGIVDQRRIKMETV